MWREMVKWHSKKVNYGPPHPYIDTCTNTFAGVQMGRVLLLNNACYVDSIKDTWAERAKNHSGTMASLVRAALEHPLCKFGAITGFSACTYLAIGDPTEKIFSSS